MKDWETLLGVKWPENACEQSGECCRGAAQVLPWEKALKEAQAGNETARDFLSIFEPYASLESARLEAPDAVSASLSIAEERGEAADSIVFYRCRYLVGKNQCQVYEDRPQLCRDFPESPFGAIPRCCGYAEVAASCFQKMNTMKAELARLKQMNQ